MWTRTAPTKAGYWHHKESNGTWSIIRLHKNHEDVVGVHRIEWFQPASLIGGEWWPTPIKQPPCEPEMTVYTEADAVKDG